MNLPVQALSCSKLCVAITVRGFVAQKLVYPRFTYGVSREIQTCLVYCLSDAPYPMPQSNGLLQRISTRQNLY